MAGRGDARNLKVEIRSTAREAVAHARAMGRLVPAALTTSMTNLVLKGLEQAAKNGIVRGHENPSGKSGSWYAIPVPGADHRMDKPTYYDVRSGAANIVYKRDAKGHIKDREVNQFGPLRAYLFRDKVVSRTGNLDDLFEFDWSREFTVTDWVLQGTHDLVFLENYDGATISAKDGVVLFQTTWDNRGQKIAFLEKSRADNGRLQPRYFIRRNLQSVSRRWSTSFRSEMKRAEKLADKAAARAKDKQA